MYCTGPKILFSTGFKKCPRFILPYVLVVKEHFALCWVVETEKKSHQSRLKRNGKKCSPFQLGKIGLLKKQPFTFPAPVGPTIATVCPASTVKFIPKNINYTYILIYGLWLDI